MIRHLAGRIARRVCRTVAEVSYAQRRVMVLNGAVDRWIPDRSKMPDTYAEFMFRTSGPLLREPSASRRARGRLVR